MKCTLRIPAVMPILSAVLMIALCVACLSSPAGACWMEMDARLEDGATVAAGDTVTVLFTLTLTHGNCLVEISDTEFSASGAEIIGATKWKRVKERPVVVEKKLRVHVVGDGTDGDVSVSAVRICERMGGETSVVLIPANSGDSPGKEE